MKRLDLIFFDAGGGHRAAANALQEAIARQRRPWDVRLVNLQELLESIDVFRKLTGLRMEDIYNLLLKKGWTLGSAQLTAGMHLVIRLFHPAQVRALGRFWKESRPDLVVSLVPNFNRALFDSLRRTLPGVPMVTVLTDIADFPPHFWIERQAQYLICGSDKAAEQARSLGYPEERVFRTSGMILHPRFYEMPPMDEAERAAERRRMGFHPEQPVGLVLFGGEGSAAMAGIARRLLPRRQLILICGRNAGLEARLRRLTAGLPAHVAGFTNDVPRLMQLSDYLIGKPGPGSLSEALLMKLPVIVACNAWTLPQERYNGDWIRELGAGLVLRDYRNIAAAVDELLEPGNYARFRARAVAARNRAVFEIPEILEKILNIGEKYMIRMNRRTFVAAAGSGAAALTGCRQAPYGKTVSQSATPAPFELDEVSLADLALGLLRGQWSSRRLVELYLGRIDAIDRRGPRIGSVIEVNPDAAALAEQLDSERRSNRLRGPLHGIPILLKDNLDTAGRMSTSAGSLALAGWHPPRDSHVAARLRAAGALILGKTNMSEWAGFRSTHSTSGWSGRGGQTRNPYALHRNPSGSSSGSAAAVAASLCGAAIGTETDGSVTSPASINGLVGLKPTVGLVSRAGIVPISHVQDTAGPMARTVRDAAILLGVMAGPDPADAATSASAGKIPPDYTKFLDPHGLRGARLGVARKFYDRNTLLDRFLNQCVDTLKRSGAVIVDPADLPMFDKWESTETEALLFEFKADLNAYLSRLPASAGIRSLADLIAFNEKNRGREMPWFAQELFEQAEAKGPLTDRKYMVARHECLRLTRTEGIDAVVRQHKLDAIVSLTSSPAWLIDWVNGDSDAASCTSPAAIAGYPHITVPAGFVKGLPVGLSFFGSAWSEPVLFRLAYAFENNVKARRRPRFLTGVEIPGPDTV